MKTIPGYEGRYSVTKDGKIYSHLTNKYLSAKAQKNGGHLCVGLVSADGKRKYTFVHHAVLLTYVGAPQEGQVCRHLDGCPTNNILDNLCWGTPKENSADMFRHGTALVGERSHFFGVSKAGADNPFFGKRHSEVTKAKLRGPRESLAGVNNPNAKLSHEDLALIHALRANGYRQSEIAARLNTTQGTVSRILRTNRWH